MFQREAVAASETVLKSPDNSASDSRCHEAAAEIPAYNLQRRGLHLVGLLMLT